MEQRILIKIVSFGIGWQVSDMKFLKLLIGFLCSFLLFAVWVQYHFMVADMPLTIQDINYVQFRGIQFSYGIIGALILAYGFMIFKCKFYKNWIMLMFSIENMVLWYNSCTDFSLIYVTELRNADVFCVSIGMLLNCILAILSFSTLLLYVYHKLKTK